MTESPSYGPYGPTTAPPPNYLVWAILATVLFCLPLGVVSLVYSTQVNGKYYAGDYAGAQASSHKARQWALWSTILGVAGMLVAAVLVTLGVIAASTTSTSY